MKCQRRDLRPKREYTSSCNKIARGISIVDTTNQNSHAWDQKVEEGARYTQPVSEGIIDESKAGNWHITVTTERPVPRE